MQNEEVPSSSSGLRVEGLGDVEDYPWEASDGSVERRSYIFDLIQIANGAFRENRVDEAINCYSRANNIKPGDSIILSNRCIAYIKFSEFLRNRHPAISEYRPISGLDPTTHAGLALKDAEKVMSLRTDSVKSYILKANALILLERYDVARDVVHSGLQIDPSCNHLLNLERLFARTIGRRNLGKALRNDDFDCTLCLKLLYEPVTTPCGHSFCRSCLFQSMDRSNRCPLCRTVCFVTPRTCAISVTLNNIIQKNFPEEYAERMSEHENMANPGVDMLPLFVMDVTLPCQKFQLNIFEPRYRLMVRRIMEGNRRMGMVVIDTVTGALADHGCEVEITDCEPLPDGRFFLEVESRRRCHITRNWDQDGYRVGEVEWIQDVYPPEGTRERNDEMANPSSSSNGSQTFSFGPYKLNSIHSGHGFRTKAQLLPEQQCMIDNLWKYGNTRYLPDLLHILAGHLPFQNHTIQTLTQKNQEISLKSKSVSALESQLKISLKGKEKLVSEEKGFLDVAKKFIEKDKQE